MIQEPASGQVIAELPSHGPIVKFVNYLNGRFGGLLAPGSAVVSGGLRCIDWRVDSMERLDPGDPRAVRASEQLRTSVAAVRASLDGLATLLASKQRADQLRLPKELVVAIGGEAMDSMMSREQVEHLYNLNRVAADAVARAVERGEFWGDARRVVLVGWGFALPSSRTSDRPVPVDVALQLQVEETVDGLQVRPVSWRTTGPAVQVELFERTADGAESPVEGTKTAVVADPGAGVWRFPADRLPDGTVLFAIALGEHGEVRSGDLAIGAMASGASVAPVAIPPEIEPAPLAGIDFADVESPAAMPAPLAEPVVKRRAISVPAWIWWVLALLLLLALLPFILLRGRPVVAWAPELLVAPHLPPLQVRVEQPRSVKVVDLGPPRASVGSTPEVVRVPGKRVLQWFKHGEGQGAAPATSAPVPAVPAPVPPAVKKAAAAPFVSSISFSPTLDAWAAMERPALAMVGMQLADVPKDLAKWAAEHGLVTMTCKDGTVGLLIDPVAVARNGKPVLREFEGGWLEISPGRIELAGRPLVLLAVATAQAERPCSARIAHSDAAGSLAALQTAVAANAATRETIGGVAVDAWRVRLPEPEGAGADSMQITACDQTIRFARFGIRVEPNERGVNP